MAECIYYYGQSSAGKEIPLYLRSNGVNLRTSTYGIYVVLCMNLYDYSRVDLGPPLATSIIYRW